MSERILNLDAMIGEEEGDPIVVKFRGKKLMLPPSIPAALPIKMMILAKRYSGQDINETPIPETDLADLALSVLGEKQLNELLATGISSNQFDVALRAILKEYGLSLSGGSDPNGQTGPVASISTGTGDSSKPTSSESIE